MFKKIAVAFDESPESQRAFKVALQLAKEVAAELSIITVVEDLPAYIGYVASIAPGVPSLLRTEGRTFYQDLQNAAKTEAEREGITLRAELTEGHEIDALLDIVNELKPDLLVIGLRHESVDLRLLESTAHRIAHHARCNILGVH